MPIYLGSRYENATVDFVPLYTDGSKAPVIFYQFGDIGTLNYIEYTWKLGDRLDSVAMTYLGDSSKWWIIPQYNPHILDPHNISAGTIIKVPHV